MSAIRYTVRQIVTKVGRHRIRKLCGVGEWAPLKWYDKGIPGRHWAKLVREVDWITYEILEDATAIAAKGFRRAA